MGNIKSKNIGSVYVSPYISKLTLEKTMVYNDLLIIYLKPYKKLNVTKFNTENININIKLKDKKLNFNIIMEKENNIIIKNNKITRYNSDSNVLYENNHYICVNKKNFIKKIVCITKNNI